MKTLSDPERHNFEGVSRNQGGCQHLCRQKVHPSTNYLNTLGLQCPSCARGAESCALGVLGSRQTGPHSSRIWSEGIVSKFSAC